MLWWLSHSENLHRVKIRLGLFLFRFFSFMFTLVRTQFAVFAKNESLLVLFRFFPPPLGPAFRDDKAGRLS